MGLLTGMIVGGVAGFAGLNLLALLAKNSGSPYDQITLTSSSDVLGKVDAWAAENGYKITKEEGSTRLYRKGVGFLTAPMYLEVTRAQDKYTFKSYTQVNGLIIKGDMALSGNSFIASIPRSMAKKAQNLLFASLSAPPIP